MLLKSTEMKNLEKPLATVNFKLNTKTAFPNMPNEREKSLIIILKKEFHIVIQFLIT